MSFSLFAAQLLEKEGISARVIDMHTIKPIDEVVIEKAAKETGRILVTEDHNMLGGLASSVADVIADKNLNCIFKRVGIPNVYCAVGNPEGLYAKYGMDVDGIYAAARSFFIKLLMHLPVEKNTTSNQLNEFLFEIFFFNFINLGKAANEIIFFIFES